MGRSRASYTTFDEQFAPHRKASQTRDNNLLYEILHDVIPYYVRWLAWRECFFQDRRTKWRAHIAELVRLKGEGNPSLRIAGSWISWKVEPSIEPKSWFERHEFVIRYLDLLDRKFGTILQVLSLVGAAGGLGSKELLARMVDQSTNLASKTIDPITVTVIAVLISAGVCVHLLWTALRLIDQWWKHIVLVGVQAFVWILWWISGDPRPIVVLYCAAFVLWHLILKRPSDHRCVRVGVLAVCILVVVSALLPSAVPIEPAWRTGSALAAVLWLWVVTLIVAILLALRGSGRIRWGDLSARVNGAEEGHFDALIASVIARSAKYRATLLLMFINLATAIVAASLVASTAVPDAHHGTDIQLPPERRPVGPDPPPPSDGARVATFSFKSGQACDASHGPTFEELAKRLANDKPTGIVLIGSVDPLPFRIRSTSQFATNVGLALERVRCVSSTLASRAQGVPIVGRIRDAELPSEHGQVRRDDPSQRVVDVYLNP